MTKLKFCMLTYLTCLVFLLSGCDLAVNTAQKSAETKMQTEHWITQNESRQKFALGQTAYLPLFDGFMSISSRLYLINHAKYTPRSAALSNWLNIRLPI